MFLKRVFCEIIASNLLLLLQYCLGNSKCESCDAGTWLQHTGATSSSACHACKTGTYGPAAGSSSENACISCPPGKYSDVLAAHESSLCIDCPIGLFSKSGQTECENCETGKYQTEIGSAACLLCGAGFYAGNGKF